MPDSLATLTAGVRARFYRRGATAGTDPEDQYVIPVKDQVTTYKGTASSFQVPGRGGATQRLLTIHNASGSTVLCSVQRIKVDLLQLSAAVAVGINPGVIRVNRISAAPTGGLAVTKVPLDSAGVTSSSLVVLQDAQSEGTAATTQLAATPGGLLTGTFAPRFVQLTATAANAPAAELVDTAPFFYGEPDVLLRAGEGLVVSVDGATATTGNPTTHRWSVSLLWEEFTRP